MITEQDVRRNFTITGSFNIKNDIIDVEGTVMLGTTTIRLVREIIPEILLPFGNVTGDFICQGVDLTSLVNSPKKVGGSFFCNSNKLVTLKGAPESVGDGFYCDGNKLTTLEGSPIKVGGYFNCVVNRLKTLKGCPKSVGTFYCDWSKKLPLLSLIKYNKILINKNEVVEQIMKQYAGKKPLRQAIIQCQRELIDAGFPDNARL